MESRDLAQANEEFTGFEKDMQTAAQAMAPSADKLKATQWKDALPLEQKALQALLRAEAQLKAGLRVLDGKSCGATDELPATPSDLSNGASTLRSSLPPRLPGNPFAGLPGWY